MQVTPTANAPTVPVTGPSQAAPRAQPAPNQAHQSDQSDVELKVQAFERALVEAAGLTPSQAAQVRVALSVDKSTNRVIAKMYNNDTGELLRQVPTDQMLRNAAVIREMLGAAVNAVV